MPAPDQPRGSHITDTTNDTTLIVLNDDSVICRDCYEPDVLEVDPGRVPMGETDWLPCSRCGANSIQHDPRPPARR
jgi:hypothetical protein